MFNVSGKYAVVTGAASGIGLATAKMLAAAGARVSLVDLNLQKVSEAASAITEQTGNSTAAFACDVSDPESVTSAFDQILAAHGKIDALINCAGIAHIGNLATTMPEDMDRLYRVNVRGTYLCMKAVLTPMLEAKNGTIVNLASIAATCGLADRLAYSMTKGAVLAMTLSVAKDYVTQGIRCNCISPARVHTPFVDGFLAANYPGREAEKMKELANSQPIGRMGSPDEIAALALYLCSDDASFVTGSNYPIDGGFLNAR